MNATLDVGTRARCRVPSARTIVRAGLPIVVSGAGLAAAAYAALAGTAWLRYGSVRNNGSTSDPMLDRFMPEYEIVERHQVNVDAPAALTLRAAKAQQLARVPVIRAIFGARQAVLRGTTLQDLPPGLMDQVLRLGWGILAEEPDREVVVGAVTQPWRANVVFTALPPDLYAGWREPEYVKIVWSLRVDPVDARRCVFRTETRAVATDAAARERFRRYWAFVSPGVWLIRRLSLSPLKEAAEREFNARLAPVGA
jgi:hypothetical protein